MALPDEKIIKFIRRHHVLTLATCVEEQPWCSNIFYAYLPDRNIFVFTSEDRTRHITEIVRNNRVAGSVVLETKIVGKVQGLQMEGVMRKVEEGETEVRKAYLRRFPYAAVADLNLWALEPDMIKLTDNTLGFGKKLVWVR